MLKIKKIIAVILSFVLFTSGTGFTQNITLSQAQTETNQDLALIQSKIPVKFKNDEISKVVTAAAAGITLSLKQIPIEKEPLTLLLSEKQGTDLFVTTLKYAKDKQDFKLMNYMIDESGPNKYTLVDIEKYELKNNIALLEGTTQPDLVAAKKELEKLFNSYIDKWNLWDATIAKNFYDKKTEIYRTMSKHPEVKEKAVFWLEEDIIKTANAKRLFDRTDRNITYFWSDLWEDLANVKKGGSKGQHTINMRKAIEKNIAKSEEALFPYPKYRFLPKSFARFGVFMVVMFAGSALLQANAAEDAQMQRIYSNISLLDTADARTLETADKDVVLRTAYLERAELIHAVAQAPADKLTQLVAAGQTEVKESAKEFDFDKYHQLNSGRTANINGYSTLTNVK